MKFISILFLISTIQVYGVCHKPKVDFYFANGMFNDWTSARQSLEILKKRIASKYPEDAYHHYEISYNTNEFVLLQLLQIYRHKIENGTISFWKWLGDFSNFKDSDVFKEQLEKILSTQSIKDADLKKQITRYQKSIDENYSVITVAHSQGNFYTNFAFEKLNSNKTKMISVATPGNSVYDDGPYFTFKSDGIIAYLPSALPPNRERNPAGLFDHEFVKHYLDDPSTGSEILGAVHSAYNYSSRSNEPSMNPKDGYFDQDVDLILNWLNNSLKSRLDEIEKSDCLIAYALFSVYTHHGQTCKQRNFSSILNSVSDCKADLMDIDNKRYSTSCYFHYGMDALNFRESYYPPEQDLFLKMYPKCHISSHSKFEKTVSPADIDVVLEKLRTYQIKR